MIRLSLVQLTLMGHLVGSRNFAKSITWAVLSLFSFYRQHNWVIVITWQIQDINLMFWLLSHTSNHHATWINEQGQRLPRLAQMVLSEPSSDWLHVCDSHVPSLSSAGLSGVSSVSSRALITNTGVCGSVLTQKLILSNSKSLNICLASLPQIPGNGCLGLELPGSPVSVLCSWLSWP